MGSAGPTHSRELRAAHVGNRRLTRSAASAEATNTNAAQPEPAGAGVAANGLVPELSLQGRVHLLELIDVRGVVHAAAGQFRDLLQRLAGDWHRKMLVVEIDVPVGRPERDR